MRYVWCTEHSLISTMPFLYNWLNEKEKELYSVGLGIEVYEANFDRLSVSLYPLTNDFDTPQYLNIQNEFRTRIESQCCVCGNTHDIIHIGRRGVPICTRCDILLNGKLDSIYDAFTYDYIKNNEDSSHIIPHRKIRLRASDGHIFYKYSNELKYKNNSFYLPNNDSVEKVYIAGIDTKLRDLTGERIYTGDVILAADSSGMKFWGMCIYAKQLAPQNRPYPSELSDFALFHGPNCLYSPLEIATKLFVIGRVCDISSYIDYKNEEGSYLQFYDLHNLNLAPKFPDEECQF